MPLWGLRHSQRDSIMLRMSEIARKPPKPVPVRTWERGEFLAAKYMMTEREFMEAIQEQLEAMTNGS